MKKIFLIFAVISLFIISCSKEKSDDSISKNQINKSLESENAFNSIGIYHNELMRFYSTLELEALTSSQFIDTTYYKVKELSESQYEISISKEEFTDYVRQVFNPNNVDMSYSERIDELIDQHPNLTGYFTNFKSEIADFSVNSYFETDELLGEVITRITNMENEINDDGSLSSEDKDNMLIFLAVYKYSFNQVVMEFSVDSHPWFNYYYRNEKSTTAAKPKVTGTTVGIIMTDAGGAVKGAIQGAPAGVGGAIVVGVGSAAIHSIGAAALNRVYDNIADWWNSWKK